MADNEHTFSTLRDIRDALSMLVEKGLGELPAQVLVAPGSTLQAVARSAYPNNTEEAPALMIQFEVTPGRQPVTLVTVEGLATTTTQ